MNSNRVQFPQFELSGPSCALFGCKGVMVDTSSKDCKKFWKQCSECETKTSI